MGVGRVTFTRENIFYQVVAICNLVLSTSFCYKKKAKKKALENFKHMIKICPNIGHIYQNKLWNTWVAILKIFAKLLASSM